MGIYKLIGFSAVTLNFRPAGRTGDSGSLIELSKQRRDADPDESGQHDGEAMDI